MKKVILILGLSLISLIAFAGNDVTAPAPTSAPAKTIEMNIELLRPIAPKEAVFEDDTIFLDIKKLAPVTPTEATFEE